MNREPPVTCPGNRRASSCASIASTASNASSFRERFSPVRHIDRHSLHREGLLMVKYPSIRDVQNASVVVSEDPWEKFDCERREFTNDYGSRKHHVHQQPHCRQYRQVEREYHYQNCSTREQPWRHEAELQLSYARDFMAARMSHLRNPQLQSHNHRAIHGSPHVSSRTNFGYDRTIQDREAPGNMYNELNTYDHAYQTATNARSVRSERSKSPPPRSVANPPLVPPSQTPSTPPSVNKPTTIEIEISPGQYAPLRGSEETLRALKRGDMIETQCFECQGRLRCIFDCACVLCPDCRVVSPVEDSASTLAIDRIGVGLGLKM